MSGYPGSQLEEVELRAGHTEFIAKPFRLGELLEVVDRLVGDTGLEPVTSAV